MLLLCWFSEHMESWAKVGDWETLLGKPVSILWIARRISLHVLWPKNSSLVSSDLPKAFPFVSLGIFHLYPQTSWKWGNRTMGVEGSDLPWLQASLNKGSYKVCQELKALPALHPSYCQGYICSGKPWGMRSCLPLGQRAGVHPRLWDPCIVEIWGSSSPLKRAGLFLLFFLTGI